MSDETNSLLFNERVRRELYEQRVLVLDGELDDDKGTLLTTHLITLAIEKPRVDIALWIHSPGGSVPAMLAIRDVMRLIPCEVSTLALGIAYSAGQFLLSSGTRGKRRAMPHARILMHHGSAGIAGTAVDVELQANDLRHTRDTVLGLIAEDTGRSVEQVFDDSLHDRWYTSQEALEYGFIDDIVQSFDEIAPHQRSPLGLGVPARGAAR
ncbi:MAG: ClpP family protease [Terriglobales bacterium]